jgi:iron complex outermembrane receptor protein
MSVPIRRTSVIVRDSSSVRAFLALALCTLTSAAAHAQALEEVTVTAQKREQNMQDVGISVAAISGEKLRSAGVTSTIDAILKVPNVDNYSPYGPGSNANIVIRGIGLNDAGEGHEAPVTAYIDEFYLVSVPAVDFSMFDLDRTEVLRGPQGTLFGRNSTGGLVHFVTAKPTRAAEGYMQASGGNFGQRKLEAAISGPITDELAGRLSILSDHSDGYIKNITPSLKPAGQTGTDAVRGQLQWTGSEGLKILGKAEYGSVDVRHIYYEQVPATSVATNGGLWSLAPNGTDGAGYNQLTFQNGIAAARGVADTSSPSTLKSHGTTLLLRIEKDFGDTSLTAVSGYLDLDRKLQEDCDASPNTICLADFPYSSQTFTQEVRWAKAQGPTRWTTGLYFLDSNAKNNPTATFNIPVGGPTAVSPTTGLYNGAVFPIALAAEWKLNTKSYSVFGQVEHDLATQWTVIAGVRVTHDRKEFDDADNASLRACNGFPIPSNCFTNYTAVPYVADYSKTLVSGKLELDWRPLEDVLLYGSLSRGTKAGGFNNGFYPGGIQPANIPYRDESVNVLEVGEKSTFAEGRMRLNISAFYYDYQDYQTFNWEGIGGLLVNRDANTAGGEVELEMRLAQRLTATLSAAGLHTKIKDVTLRDGATSRDTKMAMAPDFTASGSLTWATPVGAGGNFTASWDFKYAGSRFTNNFNDPASKLEAYFKHNAHATWWPDDHWSIGAYVNNISDKRNTTKVFVFDSLGYAQTVYAMPRTYGAQVGYRW